MTGDTMWAGLCFYNKEVTNRLAGSDCGEVILQ